jgi:hypothetical protein
MDDRTQKAFDFAQECVKQLITLATGLIGLAITFSKDVVGTVPAQTRSIAVWSWGVLLASVLCGLWALLALTGTLGASRVDPSIRASNVTFPAALQVVLFVIGLSLTVWFGVAATR